MAKHVCQGDGENLFYWIFKLHYNILYRVKYWCTESFISTDYKKQIQGYKLSIFKEGIINHWGKQ